MAPCTLLLQYAQLHFTILFIMCSRVYVFCPGVVWGWVRADEKKKWLSILSCPAVFLSYCFLYSPFIQLRVSDVLQGQINIYLSIYLLYHVLK